MPGKLAVPKWLQELLDKDKKDPSVNHRFKQFNRVFVVMNALKYEHKDMDYFSAPDAFFVCYRIIRKVRRSKASGVSFEYLIHHNGKTEWVFDFRVFLLKKDADELCLHYINGGE